MTFTRRPDNDHVEGYVYNVKGGSFQPIEMYEYFGPAQALVGLPIFGGACVAAAATIGAGLILLSRSRRSAPPAPVA